jgi:hypothetical protein
LQAALYAKPKTARFSVRFGLQTTLSVFQQWFSHLHGDPGEPGKGIVNPRAAFEIFEQRQIRQ